MRSPSALRGRRRRGPWVVCRAGHPFGTHDGYNLWEAPDNVSMSAVALAISGGGALRSFETTVLLSVDETIEALRKAEAIRYRPPGA
ncbi:GYD domain-containing protein [Streptomyces zhihengii]|uniref:GYD domain-containing protein n=1 Tax=Streptomyces zhihengii TaxID=1818004 RepID=UPI0033A8106F